MTPLQSAILVETFSVLVVAVIFLILASVHREKALHFFGLGYAVCALSALLNFLLHRFPDAAWIDMGYPLLALVGVCLLHTGAHLLNGAKVSPVWRLLMGIAALWSILAAFGDLSFLQRHLFPYLLIGVLLIHTGYLFHRAFASGGWRSARMVSLLTVLWGLHQADHPFLFFHHHWATRHYLLASALEITIALSVVYLYQKTAMTRLEEQQRKYRRLFESAPDAIFLIRQGVVAEANPATEVLFGYPPGGILGKRPDQLSPSFQSEGHSSRNLAERFLYMAARSRHVFEWRHQRNDGSEFDAEVRLSPVPLESETQLMAIVRDVTSRKRAEDYFRASSAMFDNSIEGMIVTDLEGKIQFVNRAFEKITGYQRAEIMGQTPSLLKSDYHDTVFYRDMWRRIMTGETWRGEIRNRRKSGEVFPALLKISPIHDADGRVDRFVGLMHDISDIKRSEEKASFYTHYDALTSLPNRNMFIENVEIRLRQSRDGGFPAVLTIDIKNFSHINDFYGHMFGDRFLQIFTRRLVELLGHHILLSRLGGDQFILFLEGLERKERIITHINRILSLVDHPFHLDDQEIYVFINIGACFGTDGTSAETMIQNADMALKQSKRSGTNAYTIHREDMNQRIIQRVRMESRLKKAIEEDRMEVFFQPKVSVRNGGLAGAEALVRWRGLGDRMVSPSDFIPIAEDTGMIMAIGDIVLRRSLELVKRLDETGGDGRFRVAVNLSPAQLKNPDMPARIHRHLQETGVDGRRLEIEITEGAFIFDIANVVGLLSHIRDMGVSLALDDFGTGFSSLSYLRKLPLDELKIDKSFIDDIVHDPKALRLTTIIIEMARHLDLRTVAEGVEDRHQFELLDSAGCDEIQGYLFSRPIPADEFLALWRGWEPFGGTASSAHASRF